MKKLSLLMLLFLSSCHNELDDSYFKIISVEQNISSMYRKYTIGIQNKRTRYTILQTDSLYHVGDSLRIIK